MFSDGYANASIGPVNTILTIIYGKDVMNKHNKSTLSAIAFAGIIIGQLCEWPRATRSTRRALTPPAFGYISDKVGRKIGMLICTSMVSWSVL